MSVSKSFLAHALDLLGLLDGVNARPMFGGYGLYANGNMFGLLDDDELFLRTDAKSVASFTDAKCKQWVYPSPKGPMKTSNYRPPDDAMESAEAMLPWATLALAAGERKAAAKRVKEAAKGSAKEAAMGARKVAMQKSAANLRIAKQKAAKQKAAQKKAASKLLPGHKKTAAQRAAKRK